MKRRWLLILLLIFGLSLFGLSKIWAAPPAPVCGNGKVETGEECDDGNHSDEDQCNNQCQKTTCGDSIVQSPNGNDQYEKCDKAGQGYCANNPQVQCLADSNCPGAKCIFPCTASCGVKLLGWSWSENFGWLSLNADDCYHVLPSLCPNLPGPDYYIQVDSDVSNTLKGYGWSDNFGWVCFGSTCTGTAPVGGWSAKVEDYNSANPLVKGWAKILRLKDNGWLSLSCDNDNNGCLHPYGLNLTSDYYSPLGNNNNKVLRQTLFGWAWDDYKGVGWVNFKPETSSVKWLETKSGDIYAKKGLVSSRPSGRFNATYRILGNSGQIEALSQQGGNTPWLDPQYNAIDFPTPFTRYSNALGKLDVNGLICQFAFGQNTCFNKYNKVVKKLGSLSGEVLVSGGIYYHDGDLVVGSQVTFNNTTGFNNAARTIVVNGNLTINANIGYDLSNNLDKFRNLASVAWIIKGDVQINPVVKNIVGAFIVLGKSSISSCPTPPTLGCGTFSSGASNNPFTVSGLIMAKNFSFQRQGGTLDAGSEVIIYDGRLPANIPPGLEDFVQALPTWQQGIFSQ